MKSRFISDPQDPFGDGVLNTAGDGVDPNFFLASFYPAAGHDGRSSSVGASPAILPVPTPIAPVEAVQAQSAQNGPGGPGSVVAETSGGITFNLVFDAAAMAAPQSFRNGIEQAASILSATITNKITVNINIDYSGIGGGAAAGPDNGIFVNYSTVRSDLINNAPGDPTFNALPTGATIQGQSSVAVWNAQLKLWGLLGANDATTDDGSATFATDIQSGLLVGVALHELTHALGRVPYGPPYGPQPDIFDLFRFTSPGAQLINGASTASASYFSVNGGNTKIADYGQTSDPSDFLNSGVQGGNDPFNEFYTYSTLQTLTAIDKEQLDALGFNTITIQNGITVAATASEALQGGARVTLLSGPPSIGDSASSTLSSATIIANAGGSVVTGDLLYVNGVQSGSVGSGVTASWNAGTGTLTLTGSATLAVYDTLLSEVSYQDTGADASSGSHPVRTVTWTVNDGTSNYSTTSQIAVDRLPVATNDVATNAVGSTLTTTATSGLLSNDTDLDGDTLTVTGISDTAHGAGSVGASLAGVYGHLTLNANGSYSYVADNSSAINGAPSGSHLQDAFSYTINDGKGGTAAATLTITLDRLPVVTAANVALGAGHASVAATSLFAATDPDGNTITTYGFEDTGNGHFVLNGVVQSNNQEIDVTAAQLSQLTYQSMPGSLDTIEIRLNDGTLWSNWSSFTVTAPPVVIQTDGSTSLTEVGSNYFLDPVGGSSGPQLKLGSAAVVAGQIIDWAPIGAVQTASGYDVAWKDAATNQYAVWTADSSGNFVSSTGEIAATSITLETYETTLNQDLNGDGVIGPPAKTVIQTDGSTSLAEAGNEFFLDNSSGVGPVLQLGGAPVVAGQIGGWAPIGAVQTSTGYDVAWKDAGTNQYAVWTTDSSGNFVSSTGGIAATSTTLETYETTFNQDLNGDGVIGFVTTVIQTDGSTSLVQVGSNYFLDPVGGSSGPELKLGGAAVVAGQIGGWAPIGAVQTASGYDVAWKDAATNQYAVWTADSSGNFVSSTGGIVATSTTLETYETTFNQDLNGDGVIGPPAKTVIQTDGSTSLAEAGNEFFLDNSSGVGPVLQLGGAPVVAGQIGGWAPIGAVQTSTGYDVAWKDASTNQYAVWTTDSSGKFVSSTGAITPTSTTLETYETTFNQDLNGDGTIGVVAAQAPSTTSSGVVPQAVSVMVPNHDTFVFEWGPSGASDMAPNPRIMAHDVWIAENPPAALAHDALASLWLTQASSMTEGPHSIISLEHHDGLAGANFHLLDLHASHFILR